MTDIITEHDLNVYMDEMRDHIKNEISSLRSEIELMLDVIDEKIAAIHNLFIANQNDN